jgi:hypothetical protein
MNPKEKSKKRKESILFIGCDPDGNCSIWDNLINAARAAGDVDFNSDGDMEGFIAEGGDLCTEVEDTLLLSSMKNKSVRKVTIKIEDLKLKECPCGNGFLV